MVTVTVVTVVTVTGPYLQNSANISSPLRGRGICGSPKWPEMATVLAPTRIALRLADVRHSVDESLIFTRMFARRDDPRLPARFSAKGRCADVGRPDHNRPQALCPRMRAGIDDLGAARLGRCSRRHRRRPQWINLVIASEAKRSTLGTD